MKYLILFILIGFLSQSCSPRISSDLSSEKHIPLKNDAEVFILDVGEFIPENSEMIGHLKIGNFGYSMDCGYGIAIEKAKKMARSNGANIIVLEEIKKPNLLKVCYGLEAKMYKTLDKAEIAEVKTKKELINQSRLPSDADYAVVHFYRPKIIVGSGLGYKVRSEDGTIIGRVRNGENFSYTITDFGNHTFKAKTESTTAVEINVERGKEYFVQCGVKMGYIIGKPDLCVVENNVGLKEIDKLN